MRVLPVALATLGLVGRRSTRRLPHAGPCHPQQPLSDAACEFIALALQDFMRGDSLREVYRHRIQPLVEEHPAFAFRGKPRRENPSGWVVETMQAVLQALLEVGGFEHCLVDVVNRGGDADTTGAIAGMLAGAMYGRSAHAGALAEGARPRGLPALPAAGTASPQRRSASADFWKRAGQRL
jgi:ADP-ribosyl-[dinitrogen reductase] hydrolase